MFFLINKNSKEQFHCELQCQQKHLITTTIKMIRTTTITIISRKIIIAVRTIIIIIIIIIITVTVIVTTTVTTITKINNNNNINNNRFSFLPSIGLPTGLDHFENVFQYSYTRAKYKLGWHTESYG